MTIKWGDPIECNGVRPDWLRGRQPLSVDTGLDRGWLYEDVSDYAADAPVEDWCWSHKPCILRFKLPADHPAYVALARGFTPWSGGESAPDDWDGGEVLSRGAGIFKHAEGMDWRYAHTGNGPVRGDIIGYRKRVEYGAVHADGSRSGGQPPSRFVNPPNLTEAEVRDLVGGHDAAHRMVEALRERGQLRPETVAERFTRETGHAVTEAVEAALNWKGE